MQIISFTSIFQDLKQVDVILCCNKHLSSQFPVLPEQEECYNFQSTNTKSLHFREYSNKETGNAAHSFSQKKIVQAHDCNIPLSLPKRRKMVRQQNVLLGADQAACWHGALRCRGSSHCQLDFLLSESAMECRIIYILLLLGIEAMNEYLMNYLLYIVFFHCTGFSLLQSLLYTLFHLLFPYMHIFPLLCGCLQHQHAEY